MAKGIDYNDADIERELDPDLVEVGGMSALIETVASLKLTLDENHRKMTQAMDKLTKAVEKNGNKDYSRELSQLSQAFMSKQSGESFHFKIERDQQGLMQDVYVSPRNPH